MEAYKRFHYGKVVNAINYNLTVVETFVRLLYLNLVWKSREGHDPPPAADAHGFDWNCILFKVIMTKSNLKKNYDFILLTSSFLHHRKTSPNYCRKISIGPPKILIGPLNQNFWLLQWDSVLLDSNDRRKVS